jgi:hypothetical protein
MVQFRIRVALFKGQESIDLFRLGSLPDELGKLFRAIADDAGVPPMDNEWRASSFSNGSLEFTAALPDRVSKEVVGRCNNISESIFSGDRQGAFRYGVTDQTLLRYGSVARRIQPGEVICLGTLSRTERKNPKKWHTVTAETVKRLTADVRPYFDYHGGAIGYIHSFYITAERPHFDLRDITREELIKCYFGLGLHNTVVNMLIPRERRLHVGGMIRANRLNKSIESIQVDRIEPVDNLTEEEIERFFGCAPQLTGGKSAADFIADARDDEQ